MGIIPYLALYNEHHALIYPSSFCSLYKKSHVWGGRGENQNEGKVTAS